MADSLEDKNRDEELREIFADFKKKKQESVIDEEQENSKVFSSQKIRKLITVFGAGLSLVLCFYLFVIVFGKSSPFKSPEPWAIGQKYATDYKIDGCIFRLWQLKRSIDLYYSENKRFPETMKQLYDGGYLKSVFVCPASNKEYVFDVKNNKRVFACPNPGAHSEDIISIYCNVINSPPIIER